MVIQANGTDLFCREEGPRDGLPVVLLHAFPFSQAMWEPQRAALARDFRVVAYDVRGLGRSPVGDGQYTMETLVDDLVGVLDALGIASAVLCGLSLGGFIALRAAQRELGRVRGLVLADTRGEADDNERRLARCRIVRDIQRGGLVDFAEGFLRRVFAPASLARSLPCVASARELILACDPRGVCGAELAMLSRTDTTPGLAGIRAPTLALGGEEDALTPPEVVRRLAQAVPGGRFAAIPGAGHMSNWENPEEFNRLLLDFLRGLPWP